jgi:hypothetical protein
VEKKTFVEKNNFSTHAAQQKTTTGANPTIVTYVQRQRS